MANQRKTIKPEKTSPVTKAETGDNQSPEKVLNIVINTHPGTKLNVHHWEIDPQQDADPERVGVQNRDFCYTTILDPLEPKVETWQVIKKGQLSRTPISTIGLPFIEEVPA